MASVRTLSGFLVPAASNVEMTVIPHKPGAGQVPPQRLFREEYTVYSSKELDEIRKIKDRKSEDFLYNLVRFVSRISRSLNMFIKYELQNPASALHVKFLRDLEKLIHTREYFSLDPYRQSLLYGSDSIRSASQIKIKADITLEDELINILCAAPYELYPSDPTGADYLFGIVDLIIPSVNNIPQFK